MYPVQCSGKNIPLIYRNVKDSFDRVYSQIQPFDEANSRASNPKIRSEQLQHLEQCFLRMRDLLGEMQDQIPATDLHQYTIELGEVGAKMGEAHRLFLRAHVRGPAEPLPPRRPAIYPQVVPEYFHLENAAAIQLSLAEFIKDPKELDEIIHFIMNGVDLPSFQKNNLLVKFSHLFHQENKDHGNLAAGEKFYLRFQSTIQRVTNQLEEGNNLDETFWSIVSLLKIHAKIANHPFGSALRKADPIREEQLQKSLHTLQEQAVQKLRNLSSEHIAYLGIIPRWLESGLGQRRFAAYYNTNELPYRFEEIPAGAVIITNPDAYVTGAIVLKDFKDEGLNNISRDAYLNLLKLKAAVCSVATGKPHTHAELSLGNGITFDLDKDSTKLDPFHGQMKLQNKVGKTCYSDIVVPDEDQMLAAHLERFPDSPFDSFKKLWTAIEEEARSHVQEIQAAPQDILRTVLFPNARTADYDCTQAWAPGRNQYGCSANISALLSKFGIDIGKQFNKIDRNISPADYFSSFFFKPFYTAKV